MTAVTLYTACCHSGTGIEPFVLAACVFSIFSLAMAQRRWTRGRRSWALFVALGVLFAMAAYYLVNLVVL